MICGHISYVATYMIYVPYLCKPVVSELRVPYDNYYHIYEMRFLKKNKNTHFQHTRRRRDSFHLLQTITLIVLFLKSLPYDGKEHALHPIG